ncbi:MAG: hypothetical protein GX610_10865, partial [Rhodococcus sp.]|nr:hypothetical protein [Rhodococcus sp. (in: high G+C Gram-positive bacteria)]
MKQLAILFLVAVIALVVWSTRSADRFEVDPAASAARPRATPTDAQMRDRATDPQGRPEHVAVRHEIASSSAAPVTFTGHLIFTRDGPSEFEPKDVEVLLAPAESVAGNEGAAELTFRRFSLDQNGNVLPDALHGDHFAVQDKSWSMAIPERDLVLVLATADGEPWSVVGPRAIPAGATSGEF